MSNHTPGPWIYSGINNEGKISSTMFSRENGELVGTITTAEANARLIAAAPDLLEALEFLLADWIAINGDRITGSRVPAEKAIAAIRKAKGFK
jgi:hypothetical protein